MMLETIAQAPWFLPVITAIAIWDVIWKGFGMWKAARHSQTYWFVAMLLINSAGILPIIYIQFFQKSKTKTTKKSVKRKRR